MKPFYLSTDVDLGDRSARVSSAQVDPCDLEYVRYREVIAYTNREAQFRAIALRAEQEADRLARASEKRQKKRAPLLADVWEDSQ